MIVVVVQPNYPDEYYHHIVVVDDDIFYDYSAFFYSVWLESNPTLGIWVGGTTTNENQIKSKKT